MRITFELSAGRSDEEWDEVFRILLRALTDINVAWLRRHPETPSVYNHVRYEMEPIGREGWQDIPTMLRSRLADCEDLSSAGAAELIVRGIGATAVPKRQGHIGVGGRDYSLVHIVIRWPDGSEEDISRQLGMGT